MISIMILGILIFIFVIPVLRFSTSIFFNLFFVPPKSDGCLLTYQFFLEKVSASELDLSVQCRSDCISLTLLLTSLLIVVLEKLSKMFCVKNDLFCDVCHYVLSGTSNLKNECKKLPKISRCVLSGTMVSKSRK